MAGFVAGLITSAVVKIAGGKLSSALAAQAGLMWNLRKDLEDMKDTMESIAAVLKDAEQQSVRKEKEAVRLWLKRLKDAAHDISDMMDDYQDTDAQATAKVPGMFSRFTGARKKMALATKMKYMRDKLRKINEQGQTFNFAQSTPASQEQPCYDERETTSHVKEAEIIGRDGEKKEITDILSASHSKGGAMVLPIYGLGGMGKSTMAQLVYNDTQFKQYYDHRVWVYVSQEFDLNKIGRSIISHLPIAGGQQNTDTLQLVQQCLNDLLPGKKILIVLDDIWEEDDFKLKNLKGMLDKKCSMIDVIVTTRSKGVANKICTNEPYELKPLKDNICWDIIKRYSRFEDKSNKGQLEQIGLDVAMKCGGVALAAQALGYTLKSKDLHGWSEISSSDIWNESSEVDDSQHKKVLPSLKLSYERMLPILKLCFSYCAIFPKGHGIHEDDLVHQWFALDFIKNPSKGKEYIKQLLEMSFLQHSKLPQFFEGLYYTMHDLVHDLARSVIGDELIVIDAATKKSHNTSQHKYGRYAVLTNYDGQTKLSNILPKKVRALHFSSSSKLGPHDGSFSFAKCLRIMDFSECSGIILPSSIGQVNRLRCLIAPRVQNERLPEPIAELSKLQCLNLREPFLMSTLPEAIGKLRGLRYLYLSRCYDILTIPESFDGLKSLVHLDISHCRRITVLPESLDGLDSLVHLDMSHCHGVTILPESLGGLESLVHLDMSHCHGVTVLPKSLGELKSLVHLDMSYCSGVTVLPESLGGLESLVHLDMSHCCGVIVLPESLGGLKSLVHFDMSYCRRVTVLPESLGGLKSLVHLDMSYCRRVSIIPKTLGGLKSLERLYMSWCIKITVLPESLSRLKSLVHLDMSHCHGFTVLPKSLSALESLVHLDISDCFGITILPESLAGLKSLVHLNMSSCKGITVLPESLGRMESLMHLDMSQCYEVIVLPESLGGLKSLVHLDISNCCEVTVLPKSLGGLKSLVHLDMSHCCRITVLPESLGGLKSLVHLDMSHCHGVTVFPESLGGLESLVQLHISGGFGITVLLESLGHLTNLQYLNLYDCPSVKELPKSFGGLTNLRLLDLSSSDSIIVPEAITNLVHLLYCHIVTLSSSYCPFRITPWAINSRCRWFRYYRPPPITSSSDKYTVSAFILLPWCQRIT